jgi:hypothetical protein
MKEAIYSSETSGSFRATQPCIRKALPGFLHISDVLLSLKASCTFYFPIRDLARDAKSNRTIEVQLERKRKEGDCFNFR